MTGKSELRKAALAARDALDPQERTAKSHLIASMLESLKLPDKGVVSAFFPIRSEVDLRPAVDRLLDRGHQVGLPAILDKETIVFRAYTKNTILIDGGFGTVYPSSDAELLEPDVLLMPLAAFDDDGNRIGYGGGFYDRAIARLHACGKKPDLIGVAFACQRVGPIDVEAHDVPLHAILTEQGLTRFPR